MLIVSVSTDEPIFPNVHQQFVESDVNIIISPLGKPLDNPKCVVFCRDMNVLRRLRLLTGIAYQWQATLGAGEPMFLVRRSVLALLQFYKAKGIVLSPVAEAILAKA